MSMLFVGALAIAGISATMISINTTMENKAVQTELESILQKLSESIHTLLNAGERQIQGGATNVYLALMLTLPSEVQNEEYQIAVESNNVTYVLVAHLLDKPSIEVQVNLMIEPTTITISGSIQSTQSAPRLVFTYDQGIKSIILEAA